MGYAHVHRRDLIELAGQLRIFGRGKRQADEATTLSFPRRGPIPHRAIFPSDLPPKGPRLRCSEF
jgi:hypothetical protein